MDENIKEQILYIRSTGLTNMIDVTMVQRLADEYGFYELVIFLEENKAEYVHFILYGGIKYTVFFRNNCHIYASN